MQPTQYKDINEILFLLKNGLISVLGENFVGLYLTGSLSYGGFNRGSSDVDFLVVTYYPLSREKLREVIKIHNHIGKLFPKWRKRIEGSYITKKMLSNKEPPKAKRPYFNTGKMWFIPYGNEWIIYIYQLNKFGIAISGPNLKTITPKVSIDNVIEASQKNLIKEWQPKLKKPSPFENPDYNRNHLQAYAILTMCRILYTAHNKKIVTKRTASSWAKNKYNKQWGNLIEKAENWKHGIDMNVEKETLNFIKFTIEKVCV